MLQLPDASAAAESPLCSHQAAVTLEQFQLTPTAAAATALQSNSTQVHVV
jgi:hypothetical protein